MSSFQLWSVDEYGQGSIVSSNKDLEKIIEIAKREVNNLNVDNVLTAEEKMKNWEAFFIEFESDDKLYAGKNPRGNHTVYVIEDDEDGNEQFKQVPIGDVEDDMLVYLGVLDREPWYAKDDRGNDITDINSRFLNGKTSYFIKKI